MRFVSTRGECPDLGFIDAVATGLAPDGGLYVPQTLPQIGDKLERWQHLNYVDLCTEFFQLFATDLPQDQLHHCIETAYTGFTHPDVAPLRRLRAGLHVLELFHGPTLAFKDFALQLLGNFYECQIARSGQPITVLGATSGDTGAAAIHGLLGKKGVRIFILYPDGGVSPLQERQMTCTGADNVYAIRIRGTFDDAQAAIKTVFGDLGFRRAYNLSAVNSINLARVLAQSVYYIYAWCRLPAAERDDLTFVVPTGNFGNVLAGWWTYKMGLPVKAFRVATNQNDILHRLFQSGRYQVGQVAPSSAPSMDIQVASNFERFLYYHEGEDAARVRSIMNAFRTDGDYFFEAFAADIFESSRADDERIRAHIESVYRQFDYVVDPHTACGFEALPDSGNHVLLATAHPAKFPDVIEQAIGQRPTAQTLESLRQRQPVSYPLTAEPDAIKAFIRAHGFPTSANPT